MNLNDKVFRNNPVWDGTTEGATMDLTGGGAKDDISGAGNPGLNGTYIIISNKSGQLLSVHAGNTAAEIVVPVGGTFETAIGTGADIRLSVAGGAAAAGAHIFLFH